MRKLLLLAGILITASMSFGAFAAIYKTVDEDGNVTFSDQPSSGAEVIEKKDIPTVPSRVPEADFSGSDEDNGGENETGGRYESITIVSPENDTAIRENSGRVTVSVSVKPGLAEAHQVVLYMDGTEAARSRSPVFQFSNVDRGTHTLAAAVVGSDDNELIRSDTVSFTLHRHSVQHPNANNPNAPNNSGPTPTNPPSADGNAPSPSGPTPTNPPSP